MRSAGRIAFVGTGALAAAVLAAVVARIALGGTGPVDGTTSVVTSTAVGALLLGALVWLGTYIGARLAPPAQRTGRLARWLGAIYALVGVALTVPVRTHAIRIDLPISGAQSPDTSLLGPLTIALVSLASLVSLAIAVTRILAATLAICNAASGRGDT